MSLSFYRALLRLYPASYRAEYEAELLRTFGESNRGRSGVGALFAAIGDVVPNALDAHWSILRQDLHYAGRTLTRSRGFVTTVVLVTALGVGANTATFSFADLVLLRPLPFPNPNELVRLCEGPKEGGGWGCMNELSPANFRDVVAMTTKVRGWGAFTWGGGNLVGFGEPVQTPGMQVSAQVLPTLGVPPLLGRVFETKDGGVRDEASVVIAHGLWQSQFGGDPNVIGKTIRLNDTPRVIIGVMPPGFTFPNAGVQLYTPLILREDDYSDRQNTYLHAIGRLAPNATFEEARAELALVFARLSREHAENAETGFSFFKQRDNVFPRNRIMLLALCGASLSLLLLTGANLANLLLARASGREREIAVRAALGAGRERLVRQMLTESIVLALIGGVVGVVVAILAIPLLGHLVPDNLPLVHRPRIDLQALGIAATFTALTGIGFGLLPALVVGGRTGFRALREGTRGGGGRRQRLRTVLVTVEVAMSVVLLVASGLLIRAVWKVQGVDPGFSSENVLTLRTTLSPSLSSDSVRRTDFYDRVLAGVATLPGVDAAAYTSGLPMVLTGGIAGVEIPGQTPRNRRTNGVSLRYVTPQFFATLGIPIVQGRGVAAADRTGTVPVAVVSESFVREFWPNTSPIGRTFTVRGQELTLVGIVRDIKVRGLERTNEPQLYLAAAQAPSQLGGLYIPKDLVIRASRGAASLAPAVRNVIRRVNPEQPLSDIRLMTEVVAGQTSDRKAQLRVLVALAVVALLLTGIGIHGLLAFMVAQRSREIGVRLALGAEPARVARMIVGEAARLAVLGGLPGVLVAYAAARAMSALLFGIPPGDPLTLTGGGLLVMLTTLAGSLIPAFAAVRVSPLVAMRSD
jgi:putative ABC transport system permease protein